jgi:transposase
LHPASPDGNCRSCGGATGKLGEDVTEILEYTPARFYVVRHVRPKMACKSCDHIQQAPAPATVVPRGRAGPNLLAHIVVSKFADHLPLYRQSVIYKREGVELSRSTMADWVGHVSWLLQPLVDAVADHVMASGKIHTDDTPVKVLAPGTGKTKTGRFWIYARDNRGWHQADPPAAVYYYSPDRKSGHPTQHLREFSGFMQADAYAGYDRLYDPARKEGAIVEVACWAHTRRKLHDVLKADPQSVAAKGIELIRKLYDLEDDIGGADIEIRRNVRRQSRVIAEAFFAWAADVSARISAKSALAGALNYALSCKDALLRYTDEPMLEIDNNRAENSLRGIAIGRKNYLFAGADVGGERAAAIYSLIETAKLNDVDPQAWLADVLQRLADGHTINRIKELLPWNWARTFAPSNPPRRPDGVLIGQLATARDGSHAGQLDTLAATQLIRVLANLDERPLGQPATVEGMEGQDGWVKIGTIREVDIGRQGIEDLVGVVAQANMSKMRFRCDRQPDGSYDLIFLRPSRYIGEAFPD